MEKNIKNYMVDEKIEWHMYQLDNLYELADELENSKGPGRPKKKK